LTLKVKQRISGLILNNVVIDRAVNEWQNDCGAVSTVNDERQHSNTTHVVTFDTAKHFINSMETLCLKDLPFLLIRQQKLWNDAQLRIAIVTRFTWYFTANTTIF